MPMNPPMTANTASTISGKVITAGDSCACLAFSVRGFAKEGDEEQAEHVKRRQRGDEHGDAEEQIIFLLQRLREDGVLRVETAERRHAAQAPACR